MYRLYVWTGEPGTPERAATLLLTAPASVFYVRTRELAQWIYGPLNVTDTYEEVDGVEPPVIDGAEDS